MTAVVVSVSRARAVVRGVEEGAQAKPRTQLSHSAEIAAEGWGGAVRGRLSRSVTDCAAREFCGRQANEPLEKRHYKSREQNARFLDYIIDHRCRCGLWRAGPGVGAAARPPRN